MKPGFDLVLELSSTPSSGGTRGKEKTLPGSFDLWFQYVDIWLGSIYLEIPLNTL